MFGAGSHIEVENLAEALQLSNPQQLLNDSTAESQPQPRKRKVKVAVLVSGTGELSLVLAQRMSLHRRGCIQVCPPGLSFSRVCGPSKSRVSL